MVNRLDEGVRVAILEDLRMSTMAAFRIAERHQVHLNTVYNIAKREDIDLKSRKIHVVKSTWDRKGPRDSITPHEAEEMAYEAIPEVSYFTNKINNAAPPCQSTDPELFFPKRGENSSAAKSICTGCMVKALCLEMAIKSEWSDPTHNFGVFGGLQAKERRKIIKERKAHAREERV